VSKSRGKSQQFAKRAAAVPATNMTQWALAAIVAAVFVAYLFLFFSQELAPGAPQSRVSLFLYLLTPDDVAKDWVDGSWWSFSLLDRWPMVIIAIVLLAFVALLGSVGLWMSRAIRKTTWLERYLLRIGVGLQILSLMTLLGGMLGVGSGAIRFLIQPIIFMTGMLWAQWWTRRFSKERRRHPKFQLQPPPPRLFSEDSLPRTKLHLVIEGLLSISLAVLILAIILGAMLPPWDFDVREYHLQVAKEWSQQGRIAFLPHNVYGNMPLGAELHAYTAAKLAPANFTRVWWWGGLTGKLVMAMYGPLTALLLYSAGRRYWSELAGLTAAVVYLSNPWVIHVCVNGLNECALGFYLIAALYAAFLGGKNRPCAGLAGFFAGAAASIKYTGVVFVVFPLGLLMIWYGARWLGLWHDPRSPQKLKWRPHAAIFLLMAGLSCGLWYAKNAVLTGNPVYPLMSGVLDGATRTPEKTAQWNQAHRPPPLTLQELTKSAAKIGWKDQFQSPLLIPLATLGIAALVINARSRTSGPSRSPLSTLHSVHVLNVTTILLLFFLTAWWLFTHRLERFLVPAIPLVALLAGAGVEFAATKPLKYVVAGLMVIGLTYNLLIAASPLVGDNRWFVSLERLRTDEPKTDQDTSRVTPAIRWLNEHAKPDQAVLCVGEAAVFDLEMPVFYNTCFDDCLLVNWTENKTAAERKEELRIRKIAFVYYDEGEIQRYQSDKNYRYDPRFSPELLNELMKQGVLQPPLPNAPPKIYPVAP